MTTTPTHAKPKDTANASVSDTLAALHVNPETGLMYAEVDARRKEHGYNEVAEKKGHPVLAFFGKFWGLSAWMLELIIVLSAVLTGESGQLASRTNRCAGFSFSSLASASFTLAMGRVSIFGAMPCRPAKSSMCRTVAGLPSGEDETDF